MLAATFAVGALATVGCRPTAATGGPPKSAMLLAVPNPVAAVNDLIGSQSAAAAKEVGVTLRVQFLPPTALRSRLASATAGGQTPDLALVGSGDSTLYAARGMLVDVRGTLDRVVGLNGELFPPLRALAESGPFVDRPTDQPAPAWAIPYLSVGGAWLARLDLLAKQSLTAPRTFDDARAIAVKLADAGTSSFGWGSSLPIGEAGDGLVRALLLAYGAHLFDPLGLRSALDPSATAAGLQAMANLYRADDGSPLAPAGSADWDIDQTSGALAGGQISLTVDYGGVYARTLARAPSLLGSLVALPPPTGPKGWFTSAPSTFLIVPRQGRNPDRAAAIVERLLRPERYAALTRAGRGSVIPPYAYLTKGPFWDEDANYPIFAANARGDPARSFQFAQPGYPSPPTLPVAAVLVADLLAQSQRSVVAGESSASDAAAALAARIDTVARESLALQATPTPSPAPFWLRFVGPTPTP